MKLLDFGQPEDGVIQMCYVVRDLDEGIAAWRSRFNVGPWFALRSFAGMDPRYRGNPATARCDVAFAFAGHMQIELVHQLDDEPSQFRDPEAGLLIGFHHFGVAASDFDASSERLMTDGHELLFTAVVPSGGRVAVYDTRSTLGGMTELIESDAALNEMFTGMYRASLGWDGSDPIREIAMGPI